MDNFYKENSEFLPKEKKNDLQEKTVGQSIVSYIPSVILSLILIATSALGSLLQFTFGVKEIIWTAFLTSLGLRIITYVLPKYIGSNTYYNRALYSTEVKNTRDDFIAATKDINKAEFEEYVEQRQIELKKIAYKRKKSRKLVKWRFKKKTLEYKNELEFSKRRDRQIKALTAKIVTREAVLTDEFIDKNIRYVKKLRYRHLKAAWFLTPSEQSVSQTARYTMDETKENIKEILKSLPAMLFCTFLGGLISYNAYMGTINAISILYDIMNIIFNFVVGFFMIGRKNVAKLLDVYVSRTLFLSQFKASRKKEETTPDTTTPLTDI